MADFAPAVQNTELWEGGYANLSGDSGGETYRGISRHNWPNWSGWTTIDAAKSASLFPKSLDADTNLQSLVVDFYRQNYWKFDGIADQAVANKIFDLSVNVGSVHAMRIVQLCVNVQVDGCYGPHTEKAINEWPTSKGSLLSAIRFKAEQYHRAIVSVHPEDAKFLRDWLRRDDS